LIETIFLVESMLVKVWARRQSLKSKGDNDKDGRDFHNELCRNETHKRTIGPDSRL